MRPLLFALLLLPVACLGPQVDDEVIGSGEILPAGSDDEIPLAEDDPEIAAQISDYDDVDGLIPRISAFANGQRTWYWDFGPEPNALAPIFVLQRRTAGGALEAVDHRIVIGAIPGDPGYSGFWVVVNVIVTDRYDGELLTSVTALEEAEELGLVETPVVEPVGVNCPIVARDSLLELGGGVDPLAPDKLFYWESKKVYFYDFGLMPILSESVPQATKLLRLSRVGEPPLSELERGVDITGDGDVFDTNEIIGLRIDQPGATPACEIVNVLVPGGVGAPDLIDTTGSELISDLDALESLFNPNPVVGTVVAFEETGEMRNCVQQRMTGGF